MAYSVNDRRGQESPKEACRVCGAPEVHSKEYNKPTMKCIEYLRAELKTAEDQLGNPPRKAQDGMDR